MVNIIALRYTTDKYTKHYVKGEHKIFCMGLPTIYRFQILYPGIQ